MGAMVEEEEEEEEPEEEEEFRLGEVDLKEGLEEVDRKVMDRKIERIKTSPFTYQQLLRLNDIIETEKRVLERQILTASQKIVVLQQGQPGNPNMLGTNEYLRLCESKKILRPPMDKLIDALGEQLSQAKMVVTFSQYIIAFQEALIKRYFEKLSEFHEIDKKIAQLEVKGNIEKDTFTNTQTLLNTQFINVSGIYKEMFDKVFAKLETLGTKTPELAKQDYIKPEEKPQKSERFDEALRWLRKKANDKNIEDVKVWRGYLGQLRGKFEILDDDIEKLREIVVKEQSQREDSTPEQK